MKLEQFVQVDLESDPICSSAGCDQYKHPDPPAEPPRDYFVPNFGPEPDMVSTMANEAVASKLVKHNWKFKTAESWEKYRNKAKDTNYNFAPELDGDVKTSLNNQQEAEKLLGNWEMVQTESDPVCSSAGCVQYKHAAPPAGHPMNYPVPDFGADPDIQNTLANEKLASGMINHKWNMGSVKHFEEYRNKALDTNYNFAPNLDSDVVHTLKHADDAEDSTGKKWGA